MGGRLSVHNGLLDVAWFCVYKLGGLLAGDDFKLGVASALALGDRSVCMNVV
jgi:hypothetical protein